MRSIGCLSIAWLLAAAMPLAQGPNPQPVGTMSQLMMSMVYPAANDILLSIHRGGPKDDKEWVALERSAVLLGESGNVLMMPGHAMGQGEWMTQARVLVDTGAAVSKAASAKDVEALAAVSEPLNDSCTTCHKQYRPNVYPQS